MSFWSFLFQHKRTNRWWYIYVLCRYTTGHGSRNYWIGFSKSELNLSTQLRFVDRALLIGRCQKKKMIFFFALDTMIKWEWVNRRQWMYRRGVCKILFHIKCIWECIHSYFEKNAVGEMFTTNRHNCIKSKWIINQVNTCNV